MTKRKKSLIDEFIALPHEEKERIFQELEAESVEERLARSHPLSARERKQWRRVKAKAKAKVKVGRPMVGKGAKMISLTVERGLLARADTYAKRHGLTRSGLVAQGLQVVLNHLA